MASVAFVHAVWWLVGDSVVAHGNLVDSDGYARLARIERLVETGAWFDVGLPRANWPYGGTLHWTRPLDVLLIALALPLAAIIGFSKALFWAGVMAGPLLHALAAVAVVGAARPLIGNTGAAVAGALAAVQFGILGYATIGHADHHVLIGLVAITAAGFTIRALTLEDGGEKPAPAPGSIIGSTLGVTIGLTLAFGIWVGTEIQVTAGLCLALMALRWAVEGGAWAAPNRRLALGLLAGLAAAVLIERGPGALDVQYDRISIVHVSVAALILVFWWAVQAFGRRLAGIGSRLAAGVAGGAVIVAVIRYAYPKILVSPLKDVDPVVLGIFDGVAEYAPMGDVSHFLVYAGAVLIALPWALWRGTREWPSPQAWAWLLIAAALAVYTAFAVNWVRWSLYVGLFSTVALAGLMVRADAAVSRRLVFPARTAARAVVLLAIAVGPFAAGLAGMIASAGPGAGGGETKAAAAIAIASDPRPCPVRAMAGVLNKPPWGERPRTILTSANDGAELLYRTRHRVIGTLHHPNAGAILDSVRMLGGAGGAETLALIRKRQIGLILICLGSGGGAYGKNGLFQRLKAGDAPAWLTEITLPGPLGKAFRLFEVAAKSDTS